MNYFNNLNNFPEQHLPQVIRNSILETQENTGFPLPLIFASALGSIAAASQNSIDVELPYGARSPVSLNIILIADSGEGKSPTDRVYTKPIRDFEESQANKLSLGMAQYNAELTSWKITQKAIQAEMKKNTILKLATDDSCLIAQLDLQQEKLQKQLEDHYSNKPQQPLKYKIIQSNTTIGKMSLDLSENVPTAFLSTDEGGSLFKSHVVNDLGMLNQAWEGSPLQVDRLSSPSILVKSPRVSINIAVQSEVIDNYLKGRGKEARSSGFLARGLIALPISTKGTRFLTDRPRYTEHLTFFQNRITEILTQDKLELDQGRQERLMLKFSDEAKQHWYNFRNDVEYELNPGKYLSDIPDFASKITTNLCRIAALFHYFEGHQGDISLATLYQAEIICDWYIHQFKCIFGKQPEIPLEFQDVNELEQYLIRWIQNHPGQPYMLKSFITQYGPISLRSNKGRREHSINTLVMQGKIQIQLQGKKKWIVLFPQYFIPTDPRPVQQYLPLAG